MLKVEQKNVDATIVAGCKTKGSIREVPLTGRALVRQLGSEEYDEREDAQKQLAARGRSARAALLEGVNTNPDPEIRSRCAQLLPAASAPGTA